MTYAYSGAVKVIIAPRSGVPEWLPNAGYYKNVPAINNAIDTTPSIYPSGGQASTSDAFVDWAKRLFVPDLGLQGSYVLWGSGHSTAGNFQPTVQFDLATLTWRHMNVPSRAHLETDVKDYNAEYTDGTIPATHTYGGTSYCPLSFGMGGPHLVTPMYVGTRGGADAQHPLGYRPPIHLLDLNAPTIGTSMLPGHPEAFPNIDEWGGYIGTGCLDESRQGWWFALAASNGLGNAGYVYFVHKSGTNTYYYANSADSGATAYYPPADALLQWRSDNTFRIWPIGSTNTFQPVPLIAPVQPVPVGSFWPIMMGLVWAPLLGGFIIYDTGFYGGAPISGASYGSNRVFFLKPPPVGQETQSNWVLSYLDFASADGSVPLSTSDGVLNGGEWGLVEVPAWSRPGQSTMLWCSTANRAPQVFVRNAL